MRAYESTQETLTCGLALQLLIVTAVVKLFLKTSESPAKRDDSAGRPQERHIGMRQPGHPRPRIHYCNPDNAIEVVLADKPAITSTIQNLPQGLLEQLLAELSTLASDTSPLRHLWKHAEARASVSS